MKPSSQEIAPGTWREEPFIAHLPLKEDKKIELERPKILVEKVYPQFIEQFGPQTWVYYPCSGADASPSLFFRNVIYTDTNPAVITALHNAGFKAYPVNACVFDIQGVTDLIILFNPQLNNPEVKGLVQRVNPSLVLCNNYHHTADHMQRIREYECKARIEKNYFVFKKKR